MIRTKGELIEEILFESYAGFPSNTQRLDERFVVRKVNETIAFLAKKNAFETSNVEGITYADGAFYVSYTGIAIQNDAVNTGLKYIELPASPVGLPRARSFNVFPPAGKGGAKSAVFKPIAINEVQLVSGLPSVPNTIFYYPTSGKLHFVSKENSLINAYTTLNVTMATSGSTSLDEDVNLPDDYIAELKQILVPQLRTMLMMPQDRLNDGVDQVPVQRN